MPMPGQTNGKRKSIDDRNRSVVVAMIAVGMVKVPVYQVVDVVAVRNGFMPASRTVNMVGIVSPACVFGCAAGGILVVDFQGVLFNLAVGTDVM